MSSMTLFILFIAIIALLFLIINLVFAPHNPYPEKYSIFECGFHSFLGQNRTQFAIKFFIYALIYLILDLEILLIFPFAMSAYLNNIYGLIIALIFIAIVTAGFIFELGKGALKIDSKQNTSNTEKINTLNISYIGNTFSLPNNKTIVLESSFFSFKSITLKGIIKVIIISIVLYYSKIYIYPYIIQHYKEQLLAAHICFSALGFITSCMLNDICDYMIKDIDLDFLKKRNFFNVDKHLTNSMNSGESSKAGESSKPGRIITDSDYESGSDNSTKDYHKYTDQYDKEDGEANVSKLVNSNIPEFKKTLKNLNDDELVETLNVIDYMREEYYRSKVPSAKEQIESLNHKENLVASQIEENVNNKDSKGKGKAVETNENNDEKGKGK